MGCCHNDLRACAQAELLRLAQMVLGVNGALPRLGKSQQPKLDSATELSLCSTAVRSCCSVRMVPEEQDERLSPF